MSNLFEQVGDGCPNFQSTGKEVGYDVPYDHSSLFLHQCTERRENVFSTVKYVIFVSEGWKQLFFKDRRKKSCSSRDGIVWHLQAFVEIYLTVLS